jgi:hypothetical protein
MDSGGGKRRSTSSVASNRGVLHMTNNIMTCIASLLAATRWRESQQRLPCHRPLLEQAGFERSDVYITNSVRCGNTASNGINRSSWP